MKTCLKAEVIEVEKKSDNTFSLKVKFLTESWKIYIVWTTSLFDYKVRKINGTLKVTTPPIYIKLK